MSAQFRVPRSRAYETHQQYREAIQQALEPLLYESMREGYRVRAAFEEAFAKAVGQPHAVAVHSGTSALFVSLLACGVSPGDEVITVGNADISTTAAIRHCGATPVLVDIRPSDYTMDVEQVAARITRKTRALLPVDLHGHPADVRALRPLADEHSLAIVEDGALAVGAEDYGHHVGAFADVTVFSFAPFKPLGSAGNGAAIVTGNPQLAARLRELVGYGHAPSVDDLPAGHQCYVAEGFNIPLDPLQAALLHVKLPQLPTWTARRRTIAAAYAEGLKDTTTILPAFRASSAPTFRSYTVRVPNQSVLYSALRDAGIEAVLHYTPPVYRHPAYHGGPIDVGSLPLTDQLADEILCLPVTPELTDTEIQYVIATIKQHIAK